MAVSKLQDLCALLSKYNFDIDLQKYSDLTCTICKQILKNASQNVCGCRYCYKCIESYLEDSVKVCPTQNDDCANCLIDLNKHVTIDHASNKKISMIIVKCPESFCQFSGELRDLISHIGTHQLICPYSDIGCNEPRIDIDAMRAHLNNENYSHSTLLMDSMQNMKNEIDCLKENNLLKEVCENLEMENIRLQQNIESLHQEINEIKEESQYKQNLINNLMNKLDESNIIKSIIEEKLIKIELQQEKLIEEINKLKIDSTKIIAPFEWKIFNFLAKKTDAKNGINESIYSDSFYSHPNGYKLHLEICPNGYDEDKGANLTVLFGVLAGEYDDLLTWPMNREVEIGLVDQSTRNIFKSEKYKYDAEDQEFECIFQKPAARELDDKKYMYGATNFIGLDELINNSNLFRDDSILIKCFVN